MTIFSPAGHDVETFIDLRDEHGDVVRIVLSVGLLGHAEGIDMDGPVKKMLDELHLRKIDLADEVLVLNRDGYVGDSTRREIAYARSLGKTLRWLETPS